MYRKLFSRHILIGETFQSGTLIFDDKIRAFLPADTGDAVPTGGPDADCIGICAASEKAGAGRNGICAASEKADAGRNGMCAASGKADTDRPDIGRESGEAAESQPYEDLADCYVVPGLVDIHTHAAMGADASDGEAEGLNVMSRFYASNGVTSFCPTTMTLKEPELARACRTIRDFRRPSGGARCAGVNLEGPFVSEQKRGAQNRDNIHVPDLDMLLRLQETAGGCVRLVTVAPETEGGIAFIREASKICQVSLGHTMTDYETAVRAFQAGAGHVTHLFNAMPPLHHRMPGLIGAAYDCGASVELICDGLHVHPSAVRIAEDLFRGRLALISDSLRCTGMPDGDYPFGGQMITLKDQKATLKGSDTLAGSVISLLEGVRRAVSFGISLERALTAASAVPAAVIGKSGEIGSLRGGCSADILALDSSLRVRKVWIGGKTV